ncbi:MAG: hypothetical protein ACRD5K_08455, partial [Candidatus Acidiferrales bacterium]
MNQALARSSSVTLIPGQVQAVTGFGITAETAFGDRIISVRFGTTMLVGSSLHFRAGRDVLGESAQHRLAVRAGRS